MSDGWGGFEFLSSRFYKRRSLPYTCIGALVVEAVLLLLLASFVCLLNCLLVCTQNAHTHMPGKNNNNDKRKKLGRGGGDAKEITSSSTDASDGIYAFVKRVVDGDTIRARPVIMTARSKTQSGPLMMQGKTVTVRIAGIDAPELSQEFGEDAKMHLRELLSNKTMHRRALNNNNRHAVFPLVFLKYASPKRPYDRYGRLLADILYTPLKLLTDGDSGASNSSGHDTVSKDMLHDGYAWHFVRYSSDPVLQWSEDEARKTRRGLWWSATPGKTPPPQAPWEYRKLQKQKRRSSV